MILAAEALVKPGDGDCTPKLFKVGVVDKKRSRAETSGWKCVFWGGGPRGGVNIKE